MPALTEKEKTEKVTKILYSSYGSGTGYLFGFPPEQRFNVEGIVTAVLRILDDLKDFPEDWE